MSPPDDLAKVAAEARQSVVVDRELSHEDYLAHPALNSSTIKACIKSPWGYQRMKAYPSEPTPAMIRGTLVHMRLLEPERYAREVALCPAELRPNTKAHKEWRAEHVGRLQVSVADNETVEGIAQAVLEVPDARLLIQHSVPEVSCFWREDGQEMKARLDLWLQEGPQRQGAIVDVKTTSGEIDPKSFERLLVTPGAGYAVQAAHYMAFAEAYGCRDTRFVWLVVQTAPPFEVALFDASPRVLQYGHAWRSFGVRRFNEGQARQHWPRANEGLVQVELPGYAPYPPQGH